MDKKVWETSNPYDCTDLNFYEFLIQKEDINYFANECLKELQILNLNIANKNVCHV